MAIVRLAVIPTALLIPLCVIAVPGAATAQPGQTDVPSDPGLAATAPAPYQPGPTPIAPPTIGFRSTGPLQWEVLIDQQPACVTPCALPIIPGQWVTLRTREYRPVRVEVGDVGGRAAVVEARPWRKGAYRTGIVFTSLGGMAVVTGITLTAVGCSTDKDGMCTAGLITGGAGLAVTAGSIWLMVRSTPKVRIRALAGAEVGVYTTGTSAGLVGRF